MERITKVTVSSRRSVKIQNDFFTFEMSLEGNVDGFSDEEKKEYIEKMWVYAGEEVDNQISDAAKSIQ